MLTGVAARLDDGWQELVDPAWLEGWAPQLFELRDGLTLVVALGSGPPLVLVPSLPGFKESWLGCAAKLARTHRVVTFDLRDRFPGPPSWDTLLADLERVLDAFVPGPAVVLGHSMGGALAQRWALAHPERVRALVLSSSFAKVYDPPGNLFARYLEQPFVIVSQRLLPPDPALVLARWLARREAWVYDTRCDDRLLRFVRFCMRGAKAATLRSALTLVWEHDTREAASSIAAPTLIVVGERESVFSRPASEELHRLIPGSTFEIVPGVSHLHPLSYPEWMVDTVTRWLRRRADS